MTRQINIVLEDGRLSRRAMRNCDRVSNLADANGKFYVEVPRQGAANYWRRLCEWLLTEVGK